MNMAENSSEKNWQISQEKQRENPHDQVPEQQFQESRRVYLSNLIEFLLHFLVD